MHEPRGRRARRALGRKVNGARRHAPLTSPLPSEGNGDGDVPDRDGHSGPSVVLVGARGGQRGNAAAGQVRLSAHRPRRACAGICAGRLEPPMNAALATALAITLTIVALALTPRPAHAVGVAVTPFGQETIDLSPQDVDL